MGSPSHEKQGIIGCKMTWRDVKECSTHKTLLGSYLEVHVMRSRSCNLPMHFHKNEALKWVCLVALYQTCILHAFVKIREQRRSVKRLAAFCSKWAIIAERAKSYA